MEKKSRKFKIFNLIKFICLLSIFIHIKLQNSIQEKIYNTYHEVKTRDLLSSTNTTNYIMVRFVDYEFLEFNALKIFKFFRKKYFNISYFKYDYNKDNNESKLEYNIELYDEDRNLLNQDNNTNFKFECIAKTNAKKLIKKAINITGNKYYKCINNFDISKFKSIGFQISKGRRVFSAFFDLNEILSINKINYIYKINKIY